MDAGSSSNNSTEIFVYMGEDSEVPNDVVNVRVHPSVRVIPNGAFQDHKQLKVVDISEGVVEIGENAFEKCYRLECIELCEGLLNIGESAFSGCFSIKKIRLPDSLGSIGILALKGNLPPTFRIPPLITTLQPGLMYGCEFTFSIELSIGVREIKHISLGSCHSLRNLALPSDVSIENDSFKESRDLFKVFDNSEEQLVHGLLHRFEGLPIHKMLYYQSYNNITLEQLNNATNMRSGLSRTLRSKLDPSGNQQDTLGMTPLHILACSTVQNVDMYRIIIEKYPNNLITKDKWGALPLLYAIWGQAPDETLVFLVQSYWLLYPNHEIEWETMAKVMCLANVSWRVMDELSSVRRHLSAYQHDIDWALVLESLADSASFIDDVGISVQIFQYLLIHSSDINGLGILRHDMINEVFAVEDKARRGVERRTCLVEFRTKLAECQSEYVLVEEATSLLELTLWKMRLEESVQVRKRQRKAKKSNTYSFRNQCRVSCGASIVIPLVLSYLLVPADNET